jgi:hypothetical protein
VTLGVVVGSIGKPSGGGAESMQKAERVVAALRVLLGLGIIWHAWGMEYLTSVAPGPKLFPLLFGIMLNQPQGQG